MTTQFVGGAVWSDVSAACSGKGRRRAAVAFLGVDAPKLLPLRKNDVLVVNASDASLLSGATNPKALSHYVKQGVRVWSSPSLHAKVVVTPRRAVIGSANASRHSCDLDEAVVITNNRTIVENCVAFIDSLQDLTPVDAAFVRAARATWERGERGRSGGPPGSGDHPKDPGFLPAPPFRLLLYNSARYDPSESEMGAFRRASRRARRYAGPADTYRIASYRPLTNESYRPGDVLVDLTAEDDEELIWPPSVVIAGEPIKIPRAQHVIYLVRERKDLKPVAREDVDKKIKEAGLPGNTLDRERWIKSVKVKDAILQLWDLVP